MQLVFDRYMKNSLKSRTRQHRTSGNEIRYRISDNTNIKNISLKQFLSHIETKQDLTIYLTKKTMETLSSMSIRYVVTYDTKMETNIPNFNEALLVHDHEELS